ncbi:AAA family ATPase [Candidatus Kaiserbacteria bacterium]|nr:AAA family ATPase [Candidatus Kaiserbacteria bacterium]MCB9811752.1 AAA family ATPase [Candidatus Nomurabacteria bacterium]
MMHLKHLSISGFKSFAKKSELEFSSPITAIVGPNGSGKSNVAEAFRFVLGEQSIKSMRGKRGEDLIWGGTDQVARGNRASVTVTLANGERTFPVDFDEVIIERTVHRDGQNEYSINGSKVRLKDVQEVLAAANIGPTGHHIISQGEADRILTAGQRERREMIEDALGLKVYQFKKGEAEKKLKKTKENIERVASLRREVAPHLKFLEKQVKKIERSVELREQLTQFYAEYLRREDVYIAHHHDRLTAERKEPAKLLEQLKEQLIAAKDTLAKAEKDEKREALVAAENALSTARASKSDLVRQAGQLEGQIDFLVRRIEAEKVRNKQQSEHPIPYKDVAEISSRIEREVEKALKSDDATTLKRSLSDIVHTIKKFLARATEQDIHTTAEEERELEKLQTEKKKTDEQLTKAEETEKEAQQKYDAVREAIEAEASESRAAEREVFRIVSEERECESTLARIDNELQGLERDRNEFKRELQEAVALIGRGAAEYFKVAVVADGAEVGPETMVSEDREQQRGRRRELERMKVRLEELGGANDDVLKEYKDVKERDEFLVREITDLEESVAKLEALIKELNDQLNEQFTSGIDKIASEFNRFFVLMFGGGSADLLRVKPKVKKKTEQEDELGETVEVETEEEDEEAQEGIEIDVKLPNKRVRGLDMLSGGERALTSIALIFAMSQVNPPLFVILDETDAALDEANSRRYGDMIEALAKNSQLILITHNRETMSRAGILYGVTMAGDGVSKLLSVKLEDAVAVAK